MSASDSISPKSPRSVLLEEENQIRIDEISLPPDMMEETIEIVCDDGLKKNLGTSDNMDENRIMSINSTNINVPKKFESSLESCKQSNKFINRNSEDISYESVDNHPELISNICLPDSLASDFTPNTDSALNLDSQNDKVVSPCEILLSNSFKFHENVTEPLTQTDTKNYASNVTLASHNDGTMPLTTFDIPLPDQNLDSIYPPLPICDSKVQSDLKFHNSKCNKDENKGVTSDSQFDCSLDNNFKINLNLESDNSNSENCIFGTMKTCGDAFMNNDNLPAEFLERSSSFELDEKKKGDDSRYSPSKVDSDEENQDFMTTKPKVLGKEQAKKRLMAFSLSKQPSTITFKRQNKLVAANKAVKEKPPNPNKSAGVQDQFRATITAIEEEKKKIMQNMPNYLYPFSNNLSQITDTVIPISAQSIDKSNKDETVESDSSVKNNHDKDAKDANRNKYDRSNNDKAKKSRPRRSKGRRLGSGSRGGRHSKEKEEKLDRKEFAGLFKKMEMLNNWKTFVDFGFVLSSEFRRLKIHFDAERQKQKDRRRSRSPESRLDYKPVFNYLKKEPKIMAPLQAKSSYSGALVPVPFQEKRVKFTRTKPFITWSENPTYASDFFMSKQMLLENCDPTMSPLLLYIMEQKKENESFEDSASQKERFWYPRIDYLIESPKYEIRETLEQHEKDNSNIAEIQETEQFREDKINVSEESEEKEMKEMSSKSIKKQETCEMTKNLFLELDKPSLHENKVADESTSGRKPRRRRMSLVNDEYMSEAESEKLALKEMIINDVKVQVDIGLNSVKVKSKWDSDYEGEDIERNMANKLLKEEDMEIATPEDQIVSLDAMEKNEVNMDLQSVNTFKGLSGFSEFNKEDVYNQGNKLISIYMPQYFGTELEGSKGNLASQYEEFMKMVTSEIDNSKNLYSNENSEEKAKYEIINSSANGKVLSDGVVKKIQTTDWDQESDREEKSSSNKIKYIKEDTADSFSILPSSYDAKKHGDSNSPLKKKSGKIKSKSLIRKLSQMRKLKSKEMSSSDSSTDSSDSDSESSDSEVEKWKKKRRKIKKMKKKLYSSASDSESLSDLRNLKIKRSKLKKKKNRSKRSKSKDSSHGDEEITGAVLKQLDFKKQQIIKKIEEIDSINIRESKRNERKKLLKLEREESSDSEELEMQMKLEKGRRKKLKSSNRTDRLKSKDDIENLKNQKKLNRSYINSNSESPSENEENNLRRKKSKNKSKKSKSSSESSSDKKSRSSRKSRKLKKSLKSAKKKRLECSSSSESDSEGNSRKIKKKLKKKKKKKKSDEKNEKYNARKMHGWNEHLLSEEPEFKTGNSICENMGDEMPWINEIPWKRGRKYLMACERETKTLVDWEESSREESPEERSGSSSWDEEAKQSSATKYAQDLEIKGNTKSEMDDKTDFLGKEAIIDENNEFMNDFNLETKPRLIINENSLNNLIHSTKIDIYPLGNGVNNSMQLFSKDNVETLDKDNTNLNLCNTQTKRNFLDIGIDRSFHEDGKSLKQEVYSPGHTDSDLSDDNVKEENKGDSFRKRDKQDIYDPLNAESDASAECDKVEVTNIPLPNLTDILLPGEMKEEKEKSRKLEISSDSFPIVSSSATEKIDEKLKSDFMSLSFATDSRRKNGNVESASNKTELQGTGNEKRMISVKLQQKFQCKVASVFQSDSEEDEELVELNKRGKTVMTIGEKMDNWKLKMPFFDEENEKLKMEQEEVKKTEVVDSTRHKNKRKHEESNYRERHRERSKEKDDKIQGSVMESGASYKESSKKYSPKHVCQSPESRLYMENRDGKLKKENVDDLANSFGVADNENQKKMSDSENALLDVDAKADTELSKKFEDDSDLVRPIPVLSSIDVRAANELSWGRSHILDSDDVNYSCDRFDLLGPESDAFKMYETTDEKSDQFLLFNLHNNKFIESRYNPNYEQGNEGISAADLDVLTENRIRKEKRKSRSRSFSPKKRRTPDRRRSPRNRSHGSVSPRRKGKSPFSPRRRSSPRKKSPGRKYRNSRSPERRKSRSPRKRRHSPSRRSRSSSPRKHRSPKRRMDSPTGRSLSPRKSLSPRNDKVYSVREIGIIRNLIPIVRSSDDNDMDLSPLTTQSPRYDSPMGFTRSLADSTISDSELNNNFYNRDYPGEFGGQNYPKEITVNNLITLQSHDAEKRVDSPKRLTLDQRIEMELNVPIGLSTAQNEQYQVAPQTYQQYPEVPGNQYQNSYSCDNIPHSNSNGNQTFYSSQMNSDFNNQYFNGQSSSSNYSQFHQYQRHNSQSMQNSVLQVGNIMEVVPTLQAPPPPPPPLPGAKDHQIMQVGNVLQVVPSAKPTQGTTLNYGVSQSLPSGSGPLSPDKTQKGPLVGSQDPPLIVPNPEILLNPLIKAIQAEREKRRKEREKRRAERDARRKARQLRREAKLMSVNEKLKKSVQDEGLMLGQDVEEDELLEDVGHVSPPIPVEIITDTTQNSQPPAGKGILITAGFIPKPSSEKKEVKFADGVCPGEGTSTSEGEDQISTPPKPKLPKEKRYKKKKTKLKKKVKVHIIRQVIQDVEEEEEEDDLSPPPPPPGDPPPVFFARFPFGSNAQYPVYQTQTTTTTLTTVQFPTQSFSN